MSQERRERIQELLNGVHNLPSSERTAFLYANCSDPEIRVEVENLLADPSTRVLDPLQKAGALADAPRFAVGSKLGPYQILAPLGAGGMGEVWKARDRRLGRDVALKLLPAEFAQDPNSRKRFELEARAVAALNHPNIVALYDIGNQDGVGYMVAELVHGQTLRRLNFPLREALDIAAQIADGLAAAHSAGVTHRDLKPENIMVTAEGRGKILDFGLAKLAPASTGDPFTVTDLTSPGTVIGTAAYMSPEQVRGANLDHRSDIFSFGVVLYEMLAGKPAFKGDTAVEVMNSILKEDPPELPETLAAGVRDVVTHCIEKKPEQRFQSAKDLAFAIRAVARQSGAASRAAPAVTAHRRISWSKSAWIAAAGLLTGTAIGGVAALRWAEASDLPDPIRITRFASEPEEEDWPSFSPDGRSVAYMRRGAASEIVVKSVDGGPRVSLAQSSFLLQYPGWSPDGTRVCYMARRDFMCVSAAGGTPQKVLSDVDDGPGNGAEFSRDGKLIVFLRTANGKTRLFVSSPPGAEPRPVDGVELPSGTARVRLSPDATKLLSAGDDANWLAPFPNGKPTKISRRSGDPRWFPDSRHFLANFFDANAYQYKLLIADTESSAQRLVISDSGAIISADVSPDGNRIVYSTGQPDWDIYEYSMDGKRNRSVAASSDMEFSPSWSPSGDRVLYAVAAMGKPAALWTKGANDSENAVALATELNNFAAGRYSPDGRRIAYRDDLGIETMPAAGGRPVRIFSMHSLLDLSAEGLCWSPDGEWLWFVLRGKLSKVPSQGGPPTSLADSVTALLDCSPDGRWIAYQGKDGFELISPDGKQQRLLTGDLAYRSVGQFGEGGRVLYLARENRRTIAVLDVETGLLIRDINFDLPPADSLRTFSVDPSGKRILLDTGGLRYDLWMAEGFAQPACGWRHWFRHWDIPTQ